MIVNVDQRKDFFVSHWNNGEIVDVNPDNTFNIQYDDEDKLEMNVPHDAILKFDLTTNIPALEELDVKFPIINDFIKNLFNPCKLKNLFNFCFISSE